MPRLNSYLRITSPGWSANEFGYLNYALQHSSGDLYIYPALFIDGYSPRKRYPEYNQKFTKQQIEQYAGQFLAAENRYHKQALSDFELLVHDLRQLSTSIYHSAEEARELLAARNWEGVDRRISNIISAQTMLKIRTDVLDFSGNVESEQELKEVPIYRRLDKVVKCFQPLASTKSLRIHLEGTSYGSAKGPEVFEIVPYVIIDNAIKYSPRRTDITVKISEGADTIKIQFQSVGPPIDAHEYEGIFEKWRRGVHAQATPVPGSGIGLFLAKKVIEQFCGEISVLTSESRYHFEGREWADITFFIDLPRLPVN